MYLKVLRFLYCYVLRSLILSLFLHNKNSNIIILIQTTIQCSLFHDSLYEEVTNSYTIPYYINTTLFHEHYKKKLFAVSTNLIIMLYHVSASCFDSVIVKHHERRLVLKYKVIELLRLCQGI